MTEKQKCKNAPSPQTFWQKYGVLLAFNLYLVTIVIAGICYSLTYPFSWDAYYPIVDTLVQLSIISIYILLLLIPILLRWGWHRFRQGYRALFFLTLLTGFVFSTLTILLYFATMPNPYNVHYQTNLNGVDYYVAKGHSLFFGTLFSPIERSYTDHDRAYISIYACTESQWRCPLAEHSDMQIIWLDGWYNITDDGTQIVVTYRDIDGEMNTYTYRPD